MMSLFLRTGSNAKKNGPTREGCNESNNFYCDFTSSQSDLSQRV